MSVLAKLFQRKKKRREVLLGWEDDDADDDEIDVKDKRRVLEHSILYIRTADHQLWGKTRSGWKLLTEPPKGHVIVMCNLAEESFHEVTTPRIFGRDRSSYLNRQLINRFPDTPYRTAFDGTPPDKILEKLAPTKQILVGLEAEQRIKDEVKAHDYSVRGVWTVSILMALYGRSLFLPEDLFIVFLGPGGQRIVFLKDRVPVLTRLTPNPNVAAAQVDEVVRTLRYLENKQLVARGVKRHSLLLLGDPTDLAAPLAEARFDLVGQDRWEGNRPEDWRFPLFDLAIKNPAGQLAPLNQRTLYLAEQINTYAIRTRYVAIAIAFCVFVGLLPSTIDRYEKHEAIEHQIVSTAANIEETNRKIAALGVSPDLMRRTLALNEKEIASVPTPIALLQPIAEIVSGNPELRISKLEWRFLPATATPCGAKTGDASAPVEEVDPSLDPNANGRKAEISFEIALPQSFGPSLRVETLTWFSNRLSRIKGSKLIIDPLKAETKGPLSGSDVVKTDKPSAWCLTLPGAIPAPPPEGTPKA